MFWLERKGLLSIRTADPSPGVHPSRLALALHSPQLGVHPVDMQCTDLSATGGQSSESELQTPRIGDYTEVLKGAKW